MSRMKLGLFGAARPSTADRPSNDTILDAHRQEHLAGLTPVERAAAEAMMRQNAIAA